MYKKYESPRMFVVEMEGERMLASSNSDSSTTISVDNDARILEGYSLGESVQSDMWDSWEEE